MAFLRKFVSGFRSLLAGKSVVPRSSESTHSSPTKPVDLGSACPSSGHTKDLWEGGFDSAELCKACVEHSPHAKFLADERGRYIDVNPAAAALTGYEKAELLQLSISDLLDPASIEAGQQHFQRLFIEGKSSGELMFRRKNQDLGWWSVSAVKLSETRFMGICTDITQQKLAEQSLLEAEWKFQALFKKGPIAVAYHQAIFDESGKGIDYRFLDANETYRKLTGVDPRGKLVTEAFPGIEKDPFDWIGTFVRVARTGEQIRFEQFLEANGRWYDCVAYQYKPDHFVAAFLEITERKLAEAELKRSQDELKRQNGLFAELLKILPIGVFMVEAPSGKPLLANETAKMILGRGILPEVSRTNLSEVYQVFKYGSGEMYPLDEMPILRGMKGERTQIDDMLVQRPDGTFSRLEVNGAPVLDGQGHIWASLVSFVDITERKRVEEEIRRNEMRLAKMFANIGDVVAILDLEGRNRFKSPNIEKCFGWRPEEVLGNSAWNNIHPDDHELTMRFMKGLLTAPNTMGCTECRYLCKDGSYKWIECVGVNLTHDPDIQGILLNYHDISARKQAEASKAVMEAQIQQAQKMDSIGRLAGGVAHDFNNMLAATLLQLNLLGTNASLDQEARQAILELEEGAKRAANLTRQLLMFSRRAPLQLKSVDLNQVAENLLKMLRRVIGEHYSLEFNSCGQIPLVQADIGMMEQVLLNLAVNARDAMPSGGPVRISTCEKYWTLADCEENHKRRAGAFVCLAVSDIGCGIEASNLATIFEPFFTTKELGKGTGLGLSTVDGIVSQHKGWVEVQSELGRGSTFQVYLPVYSGGDLPLHAVEAPNEALRGIETILLVEDELAVRLIVKKSLEQLGYTVLDASTPAEALPLWQAHAASIDLLLSDMLMPGGVSGLEFSLELQKTAPRLPVLIMSGYCKDFLHMGADMDTGIEFLQKPFAVPDLAAAVRRRLDRV